MTAFSRKGAYGIDAPLVPALMAAAIVFCLVAVVVSRVHALWLTIALLSLVLACYLHTTLRGKFAVWSRVLDDLRLHGDERLLDLGCGRGAVLLMAAERLPQGRAFGVDIWSTGDQSGNAMDATERNARAEGVADRIELQTADMRTLPFADASMDVVVSSLAIHNIKGAAERERAIDEAWRVLRPGGRLRIADIAHTARYRARLQALGATDLVRRGLGWRMWWGSPFGPTALLSATKPATDAG
jgi:arsenite methyltransferase